MPIQYLLFQWLFSGAEVAVHGAVKQGNTPALSSKCDNQAAAHNSLWASLTLHRSMANSTARLVIHVSSFDSAKAYVTLSYE